MFFSRTTGSVLRKLGTNHPWVKGILVSLNERPGPHHWGDNHSIAKMCHSEYFFSYLGYNICFHYMYVDFLWQDFSFYNMIYDLVTFGFTRTAWWR